MPPAAANIQQQQQPTQQQPASSHQHRYHKDGAPQHRSSSSRSVNPATGMPERVGSYCIREEIGRGSFATVYRGEKVVSCFSHLVVRPGAGNASCTVCSPVCLYTHTRRWIMLTAHLPICLLVRTMLEMVSTYYRRSSQYIQCTGLCTSSCATFHIN